MPSPRGDDRLSALDAAFLGIEEGGAHMHIGGLCVLEGGELARADSGVDFDRIARHVEGSLDELPRYRQRLTHVPGLGHPTWVDDEHFAIGYHVRHTALPRPGDERQLKRLAGRIFSQRLDRDRPLWELWVVEGLGEGRFALVLKTHHCLVDGVGGVGLLAALFGAEATPGAWAARPAPSAAELIEHELAHRAEGVRAQAQVLRDAAAHPVQALAAAADKVRDAIELARSGLTRCDRTPLNPDVLSPHRRFDVVEMELGALKAIKNRLGGKLNDVVLAIASGAFRAYLSRRGVDVGALHDFRAMLPVNARHGAEVRSGNRVAMMFARLPVWEPDVRARYARLLEATDSVKHESGHARTTELLEEVGDWAAPSLVTEIMRFAGRAGSFNVVITNVPGPPFELTFLGSRARSLYPLVPLFARQGLGIALLSYADRMCWGLHADWSALPDLHDFAEDLRAAFRELEDAASRT